MVLGRVENARVEKFTFQYESILDSIEKGRVIYCCQFTFQYESILDNKRTVASTALWLIYISI